MKFGDLTFQEIRERAKDGWMVVVPTGCTEQQGPHLPVDYDTWFVETVCLAAARQSSKERGVKVLVLPVVPFGPTPEHRNYGSGYIHLPQEIHEAVISSVLESLVEQGFRRLIVWRGCGGHDLSGVVERFNAEHLGKARAFHPDFPYHKIWCRIGDPSIPGGHADSFCTSIALHLRPESVRVEWISDPQHKPVDWRDLELDFARYSPTGVIGDPTHASAELGAKLWKAVVQKVASIFQEIAETPLE
jgi:creatinine amidohydrolase